MRATTAAPPLTTLDRCDGCGAAAQVRATLRSGELLFCSHHARKYRPKLQELAAEIHPSSH